jgi:hypothetical protein
LLENGNQGKTREAMGRNREVSAQRKRKRPLGVLNSTKRSAKPDRGSSPRTAVSDAGGSSIYTVALPPYDLIPTTQQIILAPFPIINNPESITVYADANTQLLQFGPVVTGSVLRFRGLIFDDNGTLRMDCAKILDGVPE